MTLIAVPRGPDELVRGLQYYFSRKNYAEKQHCTLGRRLRHPTMDRGYHISRIFMPSPAVLLVRHHTQPSLLVTPIIH